MSKGLPHTRPASDAESQARTTNGPHNKMEAFHGPAPVQVHPANLIEEEVPMPCHSGEEYERECERCREALGMRRRHEKGKSESTNVLSADLSGPHPEAVGTTFKYMLVAVFNPGPNQMNLPFVRGISTKSAKEVNDSINSVLAELNSMLGEQVVVRLHTDAGK